MTELDGRGILAIAHGAPVHLADSVLAEVAANRDRVDAALRAADAPGVRRAHRHGRLVGVPLDDEQQAGQQANLLVGRAVGGPPWLPEPDVRALLAVRLRGFLQPATGVSAELVRFLADRDRTTVSCPAVPRDGLGSAGEIIPLAHAFQTFLGIGTVLEDGVETPASAALARRGVAPVRLRPKEGVSLHPGFAAGVDARDHARRGPPARAAAPICSATALTVDALGAPRAIFRPGTGGRRRPPRVGSCRTPIAPVGAGRCGPASSRRRYRCGSAPQAIAHAVHALDDLADAAELLRGRRRAIRPRSSTARSCPGRLSRGRPRPAHGRGDAPRWCISARSACSACTACWTRGSAA